MRREVIHIQVAKQRMEPGNVGYVRLTEFTEQADAAVKQAVQSLRQQAGGKLKALVLDLRNNPGGLLDQAVAVSGDFLARGEIVSTRARHAEESEWLKAEGIDILDGAPLVVLINSGPPPPVRSSPERCRIVTAQCLWVRSVLVKAPCRP